MSNYELDMWGKPIKKKETLGSVLWDVTKIITKFSWCSTKFIVKNTPTAIGVAWEIKKEISDNIAQGIHEVNQEKKKLDLENEIKLLNTTKKLEDAGV